MIGLETGAVIFCWKSVRALAKETMEVLSSRQLKKLSEHKYKRDGDYTLLEPYLQPFWEWTVKQCPDWWAPNAITFVGLLINVFTSLLIMFYSPDCKQTVPSWVYFMAAMGLFIYQTLDCIDGKQARRTNSASPLGELFDHGCDSVSTVVLLVAIVNTLQYQNFWAMCMALGAYFAFYLAHWVTYCSGALCFGKIDVVEMQFAMMGIFMLSGIFGEGVWSVEVPFISLPLNMLVMLFVIISGIINLFTCFDKIFIKGGVGRNGSTVADTSVLFPVFPIATVIILTVMISLKSESIYQENPCLYLLTFGITFIKITCKLIVAHMCKSELEYWDSIYCGPAMLFMNQYFDFFFPEYYILLLNFAYSSLNCLHYTHAVSNQICDYLNIYCFTITKKRVKSSLSSSSTGSSSSNASTPTRSATVRARSKAK